MHAMRKYVYAIMVANIPVINAYAFKKEEAESLLVYRKAEGMSSGDEHIVRMSIAKYDALLIENGFNGFIKR